MSTNGASKKSPAAQRISNGSGVIDKATTASSHTKLPCQAARCPVLNAALQDGNDAIVGLAKTFSIAVSQF
ncbi:hypothetical protein [Symmachiella dynata]|uniref:hypothetical protein n=1 Tax=Symmachiella dynata TaxID=2527995 RepID=UPI0018D34904|nr:hypothetical protein [Symmachiella dynata]